MNKLQLILLLAATAIFVFMISHLNIQKGLSVLLHVNFWVILLSMVVLLSAHLLYCQRLKYIVNTKTSALRMYPYILMATFFGYISPGRLGEMGRAYYMKNIEKKVNLSAYLLERFLDISILAFFALVFSLIFLPEVIWIPIIMLSVLTIGFLVIADRRLVEIVFNKFRSLKRLESSKNTFYATLNKLSKKKMTIIVLMSFTFSILGTTAAYLILVSLDIHINPFISFLINTVPVLIGVISFLPGGGFGAREFTMVQLLQKFGLSYEQAFSYSILFTIIFIVIPASAGYVFYLRKSKIT